MRRGPLDMTPYSWWENIGRARVRKRRRGLSSGFTLIEFMIVASIIGILATFAIPIFFDYDKKARTTEAKSQLSVIRTLQGSTGPTRAAMEA